MRTIKVFSTITGLKVVNVNDEVTTWGQLKTVLVNEGVSYTGNNVIENINNTTLEKDEARLPDGNFMIVLTPQKTKSGAFNSYKELRNAIGELVNSSSTAKEFFNEGKNYTNKSRAELEELYEDWVGNDVEEDDEDYDVVENTTSVDDIVNAIFELPDYEENSDAYDEIISDLQNVGNYKVTPKVELTDEEREWAERMSR